MRHVGLCVTLSVHSFDIDPCLVDVLQEELTELELPVDPMEKIFVKLAELKQVRDWVLLY